MKKSTIFIGLMLLGAIVVTTAGFASAHECASYDGDACDPDACKDGEAHEHLHRKYFWEGDSEFCRSEAKDDDDDDDDEEEDEQCDMFGIPDWPKRVCDLINTAELAGPAVV